jgi:alpha-ketoglutarate-dependent taurine dioxygenase
LLTKLNYSDRFDLPATIKELRAGNSVICIEGFPLNEDILISFIGRLGDPIHEKKNNNGQSVFDVKIARQNDFFDSFATSNLAFPLHTDCSDFESIPNCIAFLCVEPADGSQGANSFTFLQKVINGLTESRIQQLVSKKWKFGNRSRSILTHNNGAYAICYDRITMESFSTISAIEMDELDELDNLFLHHSFKIKLRQGDLILFRNDLVLHGRDEIAIESKRFIKRIRFNVNPNTSPNMGIANSGAENWGNQQR